LILGSRDYETFFEAIVFVDTRAEGLS
jgi:hypothetical protein